jgi:hypothetical protein
MDFGLKVASPIGNLVGQILFGWLADMVGRKKMCKSGLLIRFIRDLRAPTDGDRWDRVDDHRHYYIRPSSSGIGAGS